ncbi:hypothetical protein [Nostoc sp. 106C]|uniref:hypothetical protein n=1 Tax=Nostoc sp. 106C TaxID=1932667 RepID=UPI0014136F29|nr:hypothetical protein [Nostoc sp. 106C]
MSLFSSNNFFSLSAIHPPSLVPAPILPIQPVPIITPINPPSPILPLKSFRFMV